MPAQIANLFLLEDLEYVSGTRELAESDRNALRAVADWTKTFVARPHRDLGRDGPVCPFVPVALEHATHPTYFRNCSKDPAVSTEATLIPKQMEIEAIGKRPASRTLMPSSGVEHVLIPY